ncbi:MAG: FtsX-like permease family protein [Spirochaetes bacterium]|nr:FtsX-like permease family protein [Spirochaetota bacterium]
MPVVVRMAFRNIWEHKAKSLIVGTLLALGVIILIVGNAFMDAAREGIQKSFIANYTGDVFISGKVESPVSLFGVQSMGGLEDTPNIPEFERVWEYAKGLPGITSATSMASGFGILAQDEDATIGDTEADDNRRDAFLFLFGVESDTYWRLFDQVDVVRGRRLGPGETGIMLQEDRMEKISKYLKHDVKVGDPILIQGISNSGFRIRELTVVGTFRSRSEGAGPEQLSYVDINSLRLLSGMTVGAAEDIDLSYAQTSMLSTTDADSLFGGDMIDSGAAAASTGRIRESSLEGILGDTSERERLNQADYGAWHFILLRTAGPADTKAAIASLNGYFAREKVDAVAGDWQKASGPYGQSVDILRVIFSIAVIMLAVVSVIIIMNTLVISVIERTGEIGTMRAIGAGRGFVRKLFATETIVLSFIFGVVGIVLSFVIVWILRLLDIKAGSQFLVILFGGKTLSPIIGAGSVIGSLALILAVGYLAHFYPVSVALKIQPVRAMQNE